MHQVGLICGASAVLAERRATTLYKVVDKSLVGNL
jgi:hypothetical protein